jgi:hypothetical protein
MLGTDDYQETFKFNLRVRRSPGSPQNGHTPTKLAQCWFRIAIYFLLVLFGIISLQEILRNILRAGRSARSP